MLLRPGGLPRAEIERILGHALVQPPAEVETNDTNPLAPGMMSSHYAPRTPVRLGAASLKTGEALLAFGPDVLPADTEKVMNLSPAGDLVEAAANLFSYLRTLDQVGARGIAVMPIPDHGHGQAINDRLRRAAIPQD
jgi:L-threonylcarbamoyladenylate synthase